MSIKFVVFFIVAFSLKTIYCDVNVPNLRNTQNGQNVNRRLQPLRSYNIRQEQPNIFHQHQYIKNATTKPSPRLQQPLEKLQKKLIPNQVFENLRYNGNQHAIASKLNDKILTNLDEQTQIKLRQLDNQYSNHPENFNDKNKNVKTRSDLSNNITRSIQVANENKRTIIPSLQHVVSRAPNIDVKKQHLNKLTPLINNDNNLTSNNGHRQKLANIQQNVFKHQGNIQPLRTVQNLGRNAQTNYFLQNKRFALIRFNGAIEYYDDLEIIRKKYPHIRIADNIQHYIPTQNPKINVPIASPMAHSFANLKTNQPLKEHSNLQNENVLPRKVPLHTVKNILKPKIDNISQRNNISEINGTNSNFSTVEAATPLQRKVDNILTVKSDTLTIKNKEIPMKPNNIVNKSTSFQEYKTNNLTSNITMSNEPEKVNSIPKTNNITKPLKDLKSNDANKQKPPIDVILNNSENLLNQQNKTDASSNNKHEIPKNDKSIPEKDKDLHSDKSKEIISPTPIENIRNNKSPKPENQLGITKTVKNVSSLQNSTNCNKSHEPVVGDSQVNDSKIKDAKHKLKTQNLGDKSEKDDVSIDNDEDFLSLAKPIMWFSTNDPQFWKKLLDDDDSPNFLYIINVQTQPKIEKDTKTIIHANGTIVEEIVETVWDAGDDEPKISKTVKITPANAIVNV